MFGNDKLLGTSKGLNSFKWDVQLLDGKTYAPAIFTGGAYSSEGRAVVGPIKSNPSIGSYWCVSGAYSGNQCGGKVVSTSKFVRYRAGDPVTGPLVVLKSRTSTPMAGTGDSGSPSYKYAEDSSAVRIAGIFSGIFTKSEFIKPCQGRDLGRTCSTKVLVSPWRKFHANLNLNLKTVN